MMEKIRIWPGLLVMVLSMASFAWAEVKRSFLECWVKPLEGNTDACS